MNIIRPSLPARNREYQTWCGPYAVAVLTNLDYRTAEQLSLEGERKALNDQGMTKVESMSLEGVRIALSNFGLKIKWKFPYGVEPSNEGRELYQEIPEEEYERIYADWQRNNYGHWGYPPYRWRLVPNPNYVQKKNIIDYLREDIKPKKNETYIVCSTCHYMVYKNGKIYDAQNNFHLDTPLVQTLNESNFVHDAIYAWSKVTKK